MDVLPTKRIKTSGFRQGFYFFHSISQPARLLTLLFLVTLLFSCASTRRAPYTYFSTEKDACIPPRFAWKAVYDGADYFCYENREFPLRYHCIRINLKAEGLRISTFPASESDFTHKKNQSDRFFTGKRTGTFAKESGAEIAINASPFAGKSGKLNFIARLSSTRQLVGVHIADGRELSPPLSKYCALLFRKAAHGWKAEIIDSQTEAALADADFAFGGFWTVLRDGKLQGNFINKRDSRTACGLDQKGSTLYILVVEGEKPGMSGGLSYTECARILAAMGADDAMEFDGGRSSSLFIGGKNMLSRPASRINANSIGFSFK